MTNDNFVSRLEKLRSNLKNHEAILLSNPSDIHYFSSFEFLLPEEREAFLLITKNKSYLIHTSFSPLPDNPSLNFLARCGPEALKNHISNILKTDVFSIVNADFESLYTNEYLILQTIPELKVERLDKKIIWQLRAQKDEQEIVALKKAGEIALNAFSQIKSKIEVGMTELDVKDMIEESMKRLGSIRPAFPTIIAFGKNIALPHHQPSGKKLELEMPILCDFGATFQNYRSDISRMMWFGKNPDPEYLKIEKLVLTAYQETINLIKSQFEIEELTNDLKENFQVEKKTRTPLTAKDVDYKARKIITDAGYGVNFNHTTGHGVGIEIHEEPSVSWSNDSEILPGMIITIEPGIYLEGKFGYRYENTVLIGKKKST
jgi:Xaa-Pro aminopeptidase